MKKYSSTAAVILATSSSSSDATRQAEGAVATATIGRDHNIIHSSSSTVLTTTTVAPVYAGYYCMGCDDYWKRRNNNGNHDGNSSLRKNKELVSAAIKKLGRAVVQNRSSSSQRKRFKENSANAALIESNTVDTDANPLPIPFDVDEISLATEERSPPLDKNYPSTRQEDNDIYLPTSLQRQTVESTCTTTDLTASNTIGTDDNDIVISLLKENQLLKERLELLREIELREKIDLLRIGLSNALNNEHGLSSSSSSSDTEEESHHILMEQVLFNILKSNEQREKQLFYQMSFTIFLVGSLLVAVIYIHNKQRNDKKEQLVTTEGLTDLIIPSMCPTSPTESLGSITEEGVGVLGITSSSNQLSLQEENKMLRNQIDLMRAIGGPTNGVIHEDQEYDGSVLSDASISVDYSNRMRWWRFGIRPQLLQQQQQQRQQRSIVKGLDRVKADEAAKDVSLLNQHDTAAVDINDQDSVSHPQPRWGWGRRKIENDVVSSKRSRRVDDDKSNDDDRSQVSLSSMGIAASIDYQLKKMSESC